MRCVVVSLMLFVGTGCARLAGLDELDVVVDTGADHGDVSPPCAADGGTIACPAGMIAIPGGCYYDRLESRSVTVSSYCLDVNEVTYAEYRACAEAMQCPSVDDTVTREPGITDAVWEGQSSLCNARRDRADHPMNCIDGAAAAAYCASLGKRLPSSDEWDWAAHGGPANAKYPWGNGPVADHPCWYFTEGIDGTCARGTSNDVSVQGVHDLAGNVSEWTSTLPGAGVRQVCGAAFASADPFTLTTCGGISEMLRKNVVGFRCAK